MKVSVTVKSRFIVLLLGIFLSLNLNAQELEEKSPLTLSGFIDIYYSYDFGKPSNHERPSFFYNYNKHNEVNLNLGYLKVGYAKNNLRGNLALMAGTYAQYNLAGEQGLLKNIFEANVGAKLSRNRNLWLDAGIMPSHIGFESAESTTCWTLSRSLVAENSPYYEAGVRLSHTSKNSKVYVAALYLNGWQRIQKISGNQTPAFGTQVTIKPNSKFTINWSTYLGNEQPDSSRQWRYFNNFFAQYQLSKKLGFITGFDIGWQQVSKGSNNFSTWYSPIVITRYSLSSKFALAARAEYYSDKNGVIVTTATPNWFQLYGYSLNVDYLVNEFIFFRIEGRGLSSKDDLFVLNKKPSSNNFFITSSLALKF